MKVRTPEPEGFPEFWDCWRPHMRHTDGRGDARERYRKCLLLGHLPEDIIDGAKAYLRNLSSLSPEEKKFIPLAATWLHKESYLDWYEKERAYQQRLQERPQNVVPIKSVLPENHFSRRWAGRKA